MFHKTVFFIKNIVLINLIIMGPYFFLGVLDNAVNDVYVYLSIIEIGIFFTAARTV